MDPKTQTFSAPAGSKPGAPARRLFLAGLAISLFGPLLHAVQFYLFPALVPWYLAPLATLGAALVLVALFRRYSLWGLAGMLLTAAILAGTWGYLLHGIPTTALSGTVRAGAPVPSFNAQRADGRPFTRDDLVAVGKSVLVAYRSW